MCLFFPQLVLSVSMLPLPFAVIQAFCVLPLLRSPFFPVMCHSWGFFSLFYFCFARLWISDAEYTHTGLHSTCLKHMDLPSVKIFSCSTRSIPIKYQIGFLFSSRVLPALQSRSSIWSRFSMLHTSRTLSD